jgi:PKD repeat protein
MKLKKTALILVAAIGVLAVMTVPAAPAATDNTVSINLASTQVTEGTDFTVKVDIDNVTNLDVAQYDITYDHTRIEVIGVNDGMVGTDDFHVDMWDNINSDTIRVINNVPGVTGVSGGGYLAEIQFHAIGLTGTGSDITLSGVVLGDITATRIEPVTLYSGHVDIIATVLADFSANATEVLVGQSITFTAIATGGSGDYTYAWDFDNNGSTDASTEIAEYSYVAGGTYTVSLTITDTSDGADTETKTDYIHVYPALVAGCSADKEEVATGEGITFNGTATGGKPGYSYHWDFGDGNTSPLEDPTYSYTAYGSHVVTLTVTDSLGNTDTDTVTITVHKRGDADKDGKILVNDVTYVERIIMEDPAYAATSWADANGDGDWNALDITEIELNLESP